MRGLQGLDGQGSAAHYRTVQLPMEGYMALKDKLFGLIDNSLLSAFNKKPEKPVDPSKARKPLLAGIEKTKKQFEEGRTKVPHRWWTVNNGVVAFEAKVGGATFEINGKPINYIPSERFPEFLASMKAAVDAGEFDGEIANHGKGSAKVSAPKGRGRGGNDDPNHPKNANPAAWAKMKPGERIQAGLAYKNSKKG